MRKDILNRFVGVGVALLSLTLPGSAKSAKDLPAPNGVQQCLQDLTADFFNNTQKNALLGTLRHAREIAQENLGVLEGYREEKTPALQEDVENLENGLGTIDRLTVFFEKTKIAPSDVQVFYRMTDRNEIRNRDKQNTAFVQLDHSAYALSWGGGKHFLAPVSMFALKIIYHEPLNIDSLIDFPILPDEPTIVIGPAGIVQRNTMRQINPSNTHVSIPFSAEYNSRIPEAEIPDAIASVDPDLTPFDRDYSTQLSTFAYRAGKCFKGPYT